MAKVEVSKVVLAYSDGGGESRNRKPDYSMFKRD
jgi:hypothetical protein